jgi:hypothetical protein
MFMLASYVVVVVVEAIYARPSRIRSSWLRRLPS